jgi:hypothetical protein
MSIPKKPNKKTTQSKKTEKKKPSNLVGKEQSNIKSEQNVKSGSGETNGKITKAEQIDIDHLFAQALSRYKKEEILLKKEKVKEMSHLALIAEEYLSTFALIGYSLQNEKVVIFNMPSPKDEAALVDLLRSTFIDIANNRP